MYTLRLSLTGGRTVEPQQRFHLRLCHHCVPLAADGLQRHPPALQLCGPVQPRAVKQAVHILHPAQLRELLHRASYLGLTSNAMDQLIDWIDSLEARRQMTCQGCEQAMAHTETRFLSACRLK